ncbi:KRAB-A domain-containing protein 2 [Araneus ventricosus]|uniref:KRAB-A domain-containing protein 2 n=1 Tax=Araneus ventricosus TaxID=182803 RepID=A0A4Y2J2R6_ARAVE|nr:KRAB-A domain-containing protein 2 [Araneus ventricosus]
MVKFSMPLEAPDEYKYKVLYDLCGRNFRTNDETKYKDIKTQIENLQREFVIVSVDKVPNNYAIICMEFANNLVASLKEFWPALKIVHRKPRYSQSQGSVERANQDIENMLNTWMWDNKSDQWSEGLRFVLFMKNRAYLSGIRRTPYGALFGCKPKVGLTTSSLPQDVLKDINTEE